jgi:hypothetical protein
MRRRQFATLVILCISQASLAGVVADELRFDARKLFQESVIQNLNLSVDGSAIELERGELIEDDGPAAGYSYKPNEERLSAGTWIKKELMLSDPRAVAATLLVGPGGKLQALVNGNAVGLGPAKRIGGYWQSYSLPVDSLRAGKNEFVLHGDGKIWIARDDEFAAGSRTVTRHPNRSAKSQDRGKTWDYGGLGPDGGVDGEYYVRLFLDRFRSRGSLRLPVLDAGNLASSPVAPPLASIGPLRIRAEAEADQAGSVTMQIRTGPTP